MGKEAPLGRAGRRHDSPEFGQVDVAAEALGRPTALGNEVDIFQGDVLAGDAAAAVQVNGHRRGARALYILEGHSADGDSRVLGEDEISAKRKPDFVVKTARFFVPAGRRASSSRSSSGRR